MRNSWKTVLIPVLAAGLFVSGCGNKQQAQQGGAVEVGVNTLKAERLVLTRELTGRTVAYRAADIRPQVNGLILKRAFTEGSVVKAGDLLYQIDSAPYQAAYDQAKAAVAMAEANLPAVRGQEKRFKELLVCRAVSQQDYDNALAALGQLEAQLAASKAALEIARINLSYTPIKAPISGRIGRSSVTEGAMVTAYQPVALAVIQQLDPIYVDVPQSTAELLKLQKRMAGGGLDTASDGLKKVTIIREDGSEYPLEGTLGFRDITVDPSTGSVTLRIEVANPEGDLLPGMFVRALVREGVMEKAILVPQTGVSRDPKGRPYAWVVERDGTAGMRMLEIDRAVGDRWLVSSGLSAGDKVIVQGTMKLRPNVPVSPVEADPGKPEKAE